MDVDKVSMFTIGQIKNLFHTDVTPSAIQQAEKSGRIPEASRQVRGRISARLWKMSDLPAIGKEYGKFKSPNRSVTLLSYMPKGGIGKTAWSFNFGRLLALHGIKVLVIGGDFQGNISKALGIDYDDEANIPMSMFDVLKDGISIEDVIHNSEIPTLDFIPESPELALLDRHLLTKGKREYLLLKLLEPLKKEYDVIIIDCPPQWNEFVTNALVASDAIICPVMADGESKHSFKMFMKELKKFMDEMDKDFSMLKFITNGVDLRDKYTTGYQKKFLNDYPEIFTTSYLRSSVFIKEASDNKKSIFEYNPKSPASEDFYNACLEVWTDLIDTLDAEKGN